MKTTAVVLQEPRQIALRPIDLLPFAPGDVVIAVDYSGVSAGTERLLWSGTMPEFPGMGYPLVPGYEAIGRVVEARGAANLREGQTVFVPGAQCFQGARGLFGASASHLVVPASRAVPVDAGLGARGTLLALAATAYHTLASGAVPDLIVGHGVLGRLLARLVLAVGGAAPTVWESNPDRAGGAAGYPITRSRDDDRRDYRAITDVSGDATLLDSLIQRLAPGGEIVLAGFYSTPLSFNFPPAFMREARLRVAAQWQRDDMEAVVRLVEAGALSLDGLITHSAEATSASSAYRTAFDDVACLKMILDWRACS